MSSSPRLPDPWLYLEALTVDQQELLESVIGSRLKYSDLTSDDVEERDQMTLPRSRRSMFVMGHRWIRIQNVDTEAEVVLRLQSSPERDGTIRISSVVFPFEPAREISGADLRGLPVAALNAALTKHEYEGSARMQILFALGDEALPGPLDKLPRANASDRFSALVSRQYLELEQAADGENIAKRMAELNDVSLPTMQRWLARARKQGFLPPAMPKGHDV